MDSGAQIPRCDEETTVAVLCPLPTSICMTTGCQYQPILAPGANSAKLEQMAFLARFFFNGHPKIDLLIFKILEAVS